MTHDTLYHVHIIYVCRYAYTHGYTIFHYTVVRVESRFCLTLRNNIISYVYDISFLFVTVTFLKEKKIHKYIHNIHAKQTNCAGGPRRGLLYAQDLRSWEIFEFSDNYAITRSSCP